VGVSVFTGIAQGIQPLVSKGHGLKNHEVLRKVMVYALFTSPSIAAIIYLAVFNNADIIVWIFNSQQSLQIAQIAKAGLRIYFLGFFFAGVNIIMSMYLSATERAKDAFIISIARGCIIIVPLVILLSWLWQMTGIWLSFVLAECIVTIIAVIRASSRKANRQLNI
jgi:Na+-driven multidrug efflux pump